METFLTDEEITQLTKRKRSDAQHKALNQMGVDHLMRPDGSLAVLRQQMNAVFGFQDKSAKAKKPQEPNFDGLNA